MERLQAWVLCGALLLCGFVTASARADSVEPAAYRDAIEQALGEYDAKNYEEANTLFARAHGIFPNARTLRGMGMAAFELRRYDESAAQLEAALSSEVKPLDGELRAQTAELLNRARAFLAVVSITLDPKSAQLVLDGGLIATGEQLRLPLGDHSIEARADGYTPQKRSVRVRGGEVLHFEFLLKKNLLAGPPVEKPSPLYKNPWLWSGVGAVIVGAAVAGIVLATRDHGHTRTVAEPSPNTPSGVMLGSLLGVPR